MKIRLIQLHAADHCNFTCQYCTAGSPNSSKKTYQYSDYKPWLDKIKTKATIGTIGILGGEPFLNSKIDDFIIEASDDNPASTIIVTTNGSWLKTWKRHTEALLRINILEITKHPELKLSDDELSGLLKEIKEAGIVIRVMTPGIFYEPTFTEEPIKRKKCKFCPQLATNGRLSKCHIALFNHLYDKSPSDAFLKRQHQAILDLRHDLDVEKWHKGRGDTLHECCDYCRFMEGSETRRKH